MNYVSTVVGKLIFEDINLELDYMEIIDLSPADFKSSPRIREAFQNRQLAVYDPRIHVNARKFNKFTKNVNLPSFKESIQKMDSNKVTDVKFSDLTILKQVLENLSDKMNALVNRVSMLNGETVETNKKLNDNFEKFIEINKKNFSNSEKLEFFLEKTLEHHSKVEKILETKFVQKDEINDVLGRLEEIIKKGITFNNNFNPNFSSKSKNLEFEAFDDKVTFVPKIDVEDVKKSIKSEEITQDGTDDILAKLRAMKK
jgi:hypothetical protein